MKLANIGRDGDLWVVLSGALSVSLGIMLGFHTYLLCRNWTTLEMTELVRKDIFKDQTFKSSW